MTTYRVVLVEDDPMVLYINRRYLEKDSRFEVCAAFRDGRSALEYLENNPADLLLLDIYMPVFTGLDLLKALRLRGIGVQVIMTVYGSVNSSALVWNIADVGVGLIAWFNLLGLLFLVKPIAALLKDFEKQKKLGLDPVFVPEDCGIKNAELWHEIAKEHYSDLIAEKDRVMGAAESKKD